VPRGADRITEFKKRLNLWEQGNFDELVQHVAGQQAESDRRANKVAGNTESEEHRGKQARQKVAGGAASKAMKGLLGGVAEATPSEKKAWAEELIPRSEVLPGPCTQDAEAASSCAMAWGGGDPAAARREMKTAGRSGDGPPKIPWTRLSPLAAAGPSGERQEHLDDIMSNAGASQKRRLTRCLDELTIGWATNKLPSTFRWLLNTQAIFL